MKRKILIFLSALAGLFLLILVFYLTGIEQILSQMGKIGLSGTIIFLINALFILLISTFSWQLILRSYGYRLPFKDVLRAKIIGFAISYLTPSMYIGGEPLRIYVISKKYGLPLTEIGATVIVDKFLELGAVLSFIYLGSIWALIEHQLPFQVHHALLAVNILFGLGMGLILISFLRRNKILTSFFDLLRRINPLSKALEKVKSRVSETEGAVFLAFKEHGRMTLLAFSLKFLASFLVLLKPAIFFYFLKTIFSLSQLALLFALTHLILAFQFTPGAVGIFELGQVGIYQLIGIEANKALAFSLMVRIADLVGVGIALSLITHLGLEILRGKRRR